MKSIIVNEKMELFYPEELHVMSEEELSKMQFYHDEKGTCLNDPERHLMLSFAGQTLNGFSAFLLNQKDMAKKTEDVIGKMSERFGYRLLEHINDTVGDRKADGFSYEYKVGDLQMYSEVLVLKLDRTVFYFYLYSRDENKEENIRIWKEILSSAQFSV